MKILCVDDEQRVLDSLENQLGLNYDFFSATSGEQGLTLLAEQGPFAVVISDMRMPQMNGAEFLARTREISPNTTRILLTGYSDTDSAIAAINQGKITRFLTKPCPSETLFSAVKEGCRIFELVNAERQLLESTVKGSIKALTEVLSTVSPLAFGRATRMAAIVAHICSKCKIPEAWQYEIAALTSQIGCITVPEHILMKVFSREELSAQEQQTFAQHTELSRQVIGDIPRLEQIADIIAHYLKSSASFVGERKTGVDLLQCAMFVDGELRKGMNMKQVITALDKRRRFPQSWVDALESYQDATVEATRLTVHARDLKSGMVFEEDVFFANGALLIKAGNCANPVTIERLKNASHEGRLKEPFLVSIKIHR